MHGSTCSGWTPATFVDLYDLCSQLEKITADNAVVRAAADTREAVKACVIRSCCSGYATQWSHGISIYFPWSRVSPDYARLAFSETTNWLSFLKAHVRKTRRACRYTESRVTPSFTLRTLLQLAGLPGAGPARFEDVRSQAIQALGLWLSDPASRPDDLQRAVPGAGVASADRWSPAEREIVERVIALLRLAETNEWLSGLIGSAARVDDCDVAVEDIAGELTARFLCSRYTDRSRYTDLSRYTDRSRYGADRDTWIKNLTPAIGSACWPEPCQPAPATRVRQDDVRQT